MDFVKREEFRQEVETLRRAIEQEAQERRAETAAIRANTDNAIGGLRQDISNIRSDINRALDKLHRDMDSQQRTIQLHTLSLAEQSERMRAIQEQIAGQNGLSLMSLFKEMRSEVKAQFERQAEDMREVQSGVNSVRSDLMRLDSRYSLDVEARLQAEARQRQLRQALLGMLKGVLSQRTVLLGLGAILGLLATLAPTLLSALDVIFR